jgi:hypothetical protein
VPFEEDSGVFVQRLSLWKTLGMEVLLVAGAVLPLSPNFSNGLVYTVFFYKMPFFILLVAACVVLGMMAIVFLLFVWRAAFRVPVLTISDQTVTALGKRARSVNKADVIRIVPVSPGNINLEIRGERPLALPLFLYQQPALVMDRLKQVVAQQPGAAAQGTS